MIKAVLDSNIYISAILKPEGTQRKIIESALNGDFKIILSAEILEEIISVLQRTHIQKYLKATKKEIERFLRNLSIHANFITLGTIIKSVEADPDDDIIITTAVRGKAGYIVSGNYDLLDLKEYQGIKIVRGKEFMEILTLKN